MGDIRCSFIQKFDIDDKRYKLKQLLRNGKIEKRSYEELSVEEKAALVSRRYEEAVVLFVKRMAEVKPNFNFSHLEENLKTLKIRNRLFLKNYMATYHGPKNKINLTLKHAFSSIYHELMHMASYYLTDDGIQMTGFNQFVPYIKNIGTGLNEGYTELLTERYFFDQGTDYSYVFLVDYSKDIERIIGKEIMEELYFSADLYNLKEEIIKDTTEEEFIQFLRDLDWLCNRDDYCDLEELNLRTQRMGNFVYFTYLKKQQRLLRCGKISLEEYNRNVKETIEKIDCIWFNYGDNKVWKCDKKKMQEELATINIYAHFPERKLVNDGELAEMVDSRDSQIGTKKNR